MNMEEAVDNNLFVPKGYSDQVDIKEEMAVDSDVSLLELDTNPFLSKNKQRFDNINDLRMQPTEENNKDMKEGSKPYLCLVCDYRCSWSSNMKRHKKIHSGEKEYKCQICIKEFRQSSHLNNHMMIHTGEKPYQCHPDHILKKNAKM